ncbi:hypothetical protein BCR42DRAFT_160181, partial [Absidia repens]
FPKPPNSWQVFFFFSFTFFFLIVTHRHTQRNMKPGWYSAKETPVWMKSASEIWQYIYAPLFWFMYLVWESQRNTPSVMAFSDHEEENLYHHHPVIMVTATPANNSDHAKKKSSPVPASLTMMMVGFRYNKSYFKRTFKAHLKSIQQKHQGLKRSLLRRARKVTLIHPHPPPLLTSRRRLSLSPPPLPPPLKTLAHHQKMTPEIVRLPTSLVFF